MPGSIEICGQPGRWAIAPCKAPDGIADYCSKMSQNVPKCATLREFFFRLRTGLKSKPSFLSEFSTMTSGQVAGAHGSQNGKILRRWLQSQRKEGPPIYMSGGDFA